MKPFFHRFFTAFLSVAVLCGSLSAAATAAQGDRQPQCTEVTVKKTEILAKGAFKAIQAALNSARYSATKDNIYKVIVEPGSYDLRSTLHVYSNTTLSLYNVTLVRNKEAITNMIRTGDDTGYDKGDYGYAPSTNVTVEGGTLDGGATSNTMVKVTHATNFIMMSTTLCNLRNAHMMEVAAVNGFTIKNCSFRDQILDADEVGYEAIQLDIPKYGHIFGCRSEALNMRNVKIDSCYFTNCPCAVGTHTQILNSPFDGIEISNNTFRDLKGIAVQGENWRNVTISNNRIENTPRAIALYSIYGKGSGCYRASVLAKEGNTKTSVSDSYQAPAKANIVISGNDISGCGALKDVYDDYRPLAISVMGKKLDKAMSVYSDGGGGYPKGDYYIDGVTVKNNSISTGGDGIYLEDVRNAAVTGNTVSSAKNSLVKGMVNPLTAYEAVINTIAGNNFASGPYYGMELAACTVGNITGNSITNVPRDGIMIESKTKVNDKITNNYITKAGNYGILVRTACTGGKVSDNIIYGCGKGAINVEKSASANVGQNYYSVAEMTSLTLNRQELDLGEEEQFALTTAYEPANAVAKFNWKSSDERVAGVNGDGVITAHQKGEADITVTSASGKTAVCHVRVSQEPQSIKLNTTMLTIGKGESFTLNSTLSDGSVSKISYTSNNTKAVSAEQSGVIKGLAVGTATVGVRTYNGKHAGCNVIVKEAPYDIWFDESEMSLGTGEISSMHVNLPEGSASNSMVYRSDNENVVSIGKQGEIVAKQTGEATVTATAFNGATAVCRISVKQEPKEVAFAQDEYSFFEGDAEKLEVVFPEGYASHALNFQSSDPDVCKINRSTGEITAKKAGTVTITVKTFNRVSSTCKVVIDPAEETEEY